MGAQNGTFTYLSLSYVFGSMFPSSQRSTQDCSKQSLSLANFSMQIWTSGVPLKISAPPSPEAPVPSIKYIAIPKPGSSDIVCAIIALEAQTEMLPLVIGTSLFETKAGMICLTARNGVQAQKSGNYTNQQGDSNRIAILF